MTSGDNYFNYFPENQKLTKLVQIKEWMQIDTYGQIKWLNGC